MTILTLLLYSTLAVNIPGGTPLRWGFDDIGVRGCDCWNEGCLMRHPKAARLLEEFQFDLWVTWYPDAAPKWDYARNAAYIKEMDAFSKAHGMWWVCNQLSSVWNISPESAVDPAGYDWYKRPDGRRFFLFPEPMLEALGGCERLLGLMYDEAEHHQNCANEIQKLDLPSIYDPKGDTLLEAADAHTAAAAEIAAIHARHGLRLYTEQVFPVMYHGFARAGFTAGTKVLKEAWSPIYLACALGAALQYDKELWVSPDLWGIHGYPSHTPEEYRSSLLLAYHMGADCIYTESLALDKVGAGVGEGSLVHMTPEDYTVTPYGEVAKSFIREYVPAHPRRYRFQEVKPRVAIIRQEDGCWGQRGSFLRDRLFGSPEWSSTPVTEAWFGLWNLLTNGEVPVDGLTWWKYFDKPYQVLCPLDGIVVFDHLARYEHIASAEVIFLTGVGVSPGTLEAVARRVREGAVCVALPHLPPASIREKTGPAGSVAEGAGWWVTTEDFRAPHVRERVAHVLPKDRTVRYQFGETRVVFSPIEGDMNRVRVEVTAR